MARRFDADGNFDRPDGSTYSTTIMTGWQYRVKFPHEFHRASDFGLQVEESDLQLRSWQKKSGFNPDPLFLSKDGILECSYNAAIFPSREEAEAFSSTISTGIQWKIVEERI